MADHYSAVTFFKNHEKKYNIPLHVFKNQRSYDNNDRKSIDQNLNKLNPLLARIMDRLVRVLGFRASLLAGACSSIEYRDWLVSARV